MKILYAAPRFDYGDPNRGYSYEHCNFYDTLANMGYGITYFDTLTLLKEKGKPEMSRLLLETVKREKPDLLFSVLFRDEFEAEAIWEISEKTTTATLNWFCDDQWRFEDFTRHWAALFNWCVTTTPSSLPKYQAIGCSNVIKSQWACNHFACRRMKLSLTHGVTFVGNPHSNRRKFIKKLAGYGLDVETWGANWGHGRIGQEEMLTLFGQSRINLNFSRTSIRNPERQFPFLWRPKRVYVYQIKGRVFEVPGCGGFLLTEAAEDLENYYQPDVEVATFTTLKELAEKAAYYLRHETERSRIAEQGCRRTLAEHTYQKRFKEIFREIGLE